MADDLPTIGRPIILANRLPVKAGNNGWEISGGGLATALQPAMQRRAGAWIGWDGGSANMPQAIEGLNIELSPIALSRPEIQSFYYGFANRTIWPLFHDLVQPATFDRGWWNAYVAINERFAQEAAEVASRKSFFWVHDYHLMLAPGFLRKLRPKDVISFFLHIPWPPPELFARLPWREEILEGLLGADIVSFHTDLYRKNFARTCGRVLDCTIKGKNVHLPNGRVIQTTARPISIDAEGFADAVPDQRTSKALEKLEEQFRGRQVLLGVDRLDYTKGIRHRLEAFELLLERRADLRGKIALVQIAVPSRDAVKEYRDLRQQIEQTVGRINGHFTEPGGDIPIHYIHRNLTRPRLIAYYLLADALLVTPLKDGMNLVAKEYVVCQHAGKRDGALVLSEFTGAALELKESVLVNPFDTDGLSQKIEEALEMDPSDKRKRLSAMAGRVRRADIHHWVDTQFADIAAIQATR